MRGQEGNRAGADVGLASGSEPIGPTQTGSEFRISS